MTSTLQQLASPTIQNTQYPNCVSCKYYQPDMSSPNWESHFTTCALFGEKNLITGKVVFDGTGICRHTKSKCGIEGKFYEYDPYFSQRAWRHRVFTNRSGIFFTSLILANIGYATWITRDTRIYPWTIVLRNWVRVLFEKISLPIWELDTILGCGRWSKTGSLNKRG
jgi:hypothetical protein